MFFYAKQKSDYFFFMHGKSVIVLQILPNFSLKTAVSDILFFSLKFGDRVKNVLFVFAFFRKITYPCP
jgi:hypothetical protein